eukprot:scaffold2442_cov146-Cylindrotheca_fusiformis.AAC.9
MRLSKRRCQGNGTTSIGGRSRVPLERQQGSGSIGQKDVRRRTHGRQLKCRRICIVGFVVFLMVAMIINEPIACLHQECLGGGKGVLCSSVYDSSFVQAREQLTRMLP